MNIFHFLLFPLKRVKRYIFTEVSSLQRRTSIFRRAQQMFTQLRDPEFAVSILWFDMCTFLLYIFFPNTFIFTSNLFQFRITYTSYRYGLRVPRYAVEMKVWVYPFGRLFIYPVRHFAYNSVKFIRQYTADVMHLVITPTLYNTSIAPRLRTGI